MSLTGNNGLLAAAGANQPAYSIDESLRITETGGLRRMQTGGNLRKFTFSTWVKLGDIEQDSAYEKCLYTAGNNGDGSGYTDFIYFAPFASGGRPIRMVVSASGALAGSIITTPFYNDPASWYHVVAVWDSANATGADRMIIYVNGTRQAIGTITTPAQNTDALYFNANGKQAVIGNYAYYWNPANPTHAQHATDGYLADTYFIDGSVVAPSVFAEADEDTNQWKPKNNSDVKSAVTFGTNGFYLNYSDSSSLGTDSSGKGNNFTPGNLVATDQVLDSPSNNFATFNQIWTSRSNDSSRTFAEGNLKAATAATNWKNLVTTHNISSGKWYWECVPFGDNFNWIIGVCKTNWNTGGTNVGLETTGSYGVYCSGVGTGGYWVNASVTSNNNYIWAANDILMVAYDDATGYFWLGKNGTWFNSGNPAGGSGYIFTVVAADRGDIYPAFSYHTNTSGYYLNTGADSSFAGQKTSQGNGGVGEDFYYTPPTGFKALNNSNLPDPSIADPTKHFNTKLWTSTSADGTSALGAVTGVGFQPDLVWAKGRSAAWDHSLFNSVMGTGLGKALYTNTNFIAGAYDTSGYGNVTSFDSDGFTVGLTAGNNYAYNYGSGTKYVAWNWKAGGAASSNGDGTITSSVSANTTAGFSIVGWTGTGSNVTVGHGLSQAPELVINKSRDDVYNWAVQSILFNSASDTNILYLNTTAAQADDTNVFQAAPTATVFSPQGGAWAGIGANTIKYIAYCFHSVEGYSKVGKYTGNSSADGPMFYCGFKPAWAMFKATGSAQSWTIFDNKRNVFNLMDNSLFPDLADAENDATSLSVDFVSNGIKIRSTHNYVNYSGSDYIVLAFAELPFKTSNAR